MGGEHFGTAGCLVEDGRRSVVIEGRPEEHLQGAVRRSSEVPLEPGQFWTQTCGKAAVIILNSRLCAEGCHAVGPRAGLC